MIDSRPLDQLARALWPVPGPEGISGECNLGQLIPIQIRLVCFRGAFAERLRSPARRVNTGKCRKVFYVCPAGCAPPPGELSHAPATGRFLDPLDHATH